MLSGDKCFGEEKKAEEEENREVSRQQFRIIGGPIEKVTSEQRPKGSKRFQGGEKRMLQAQGTLSAKIFGCEQAWCI